MAATASDLEGWSPQLLQAWSTSYDECRQLYEDDKLEECIESAEALLGDLAMPLYHRMKFLLLLAACLDWVEVDDVLDRANAVWLTARNRYPGTDARVEEELAEIRRSLDSLQVQQNERVMAANLEAMEQEEEEAKAKAKANDDEGKDEQRKELLSAVVEASKPEVSGVEKGPNPPEAYNAPPQIPASVLNPAGVNFPRWHPIGGNSGDDTTSAPGLQPAQDQWGRTLSKIPIRPASAALTDLPKRESQKQKPKDIWKGDKEDQGERTLSKIPIRPASAALTDLPKRESQKQKPKDIWKGDKGGKGW